MRQRRSAQETRTLLFEAASRILRAGGLNHLTLAAVAREAGLSKGGLLYHFPTKEALIEALFEYHNDLFESRLAELAAAQADRPGAWLRAYARASIEQITDPETASLYSSLFAAEERYATAHRLMRQKYARWQTQVDDCGLEPDWASLIRLTVDGLWFSEMHHYAPLPPARREQIVALIEQLTQDPHYIRGNHVP